MWNWRRINNRVSATDGIIIIIIRERAKGIWLRAQEMRYGVTSKNDLFEGKLNVELQSLSY